MPRISRLRSRPSKMGRKWTQDDVLAYNTKVVYQDLTTFFGVTNLPPPDVPIDALTAQNVAATNDFLTSHLLMHMNDVMDPDPDPDNRTCETIALVRQLIDVIKYDDVAKDRSMLLGPKLRYLASQGKPPEVDICLTDDHHIGRQNGQALARVRSGDPTYFGYHCCLP